MWRKVLLKENLNQVGYYYLFALFVVTINRNCRLSLRYLEENSLKRIRFMLVIALIFVILKYIIHCWVPFLSAEAFRVIDNSMIREHASLSDILPEIFEPSFGDFCI